MKRCLGGLTKMKFRSWIDDFEEGECLSFLAFAMVRLQFFLMLIMYNDVLLCIKQYCRTNWIDVVYLSFEF